MSNASTTFPYAPGIVSGHDHTEVPNTSMLPDAVASAATPALPATDLMQRVVDGAHQTIDRLAASAGPQVQRLDVGMAGAGQALAAKADELRGARDEWAESLRGTVRENPLAAVLAALAVGVVIARITR